MKSKKRAKSEFKLTTPKSRNGQFLIRIRGLNNKNVLVGGEPHESETYCRKIVARVLGVQFMQRANRKIGLARTAIHKGDLAEAQKQLEWASNTIDKLQDWVNRVKSDGRVL